jgi:acetylglutamate kinase
MTPIVVKVGGSTLGHHDTAFADIAALHAAGRQVVVIHGGGAAATEWLRIHAVPNEFVDGLRVTSAEALDVVLAVFAGLVNKQLVAGLAALGAPAWGLSGADGALLGTRQQSPALGYVGEVTRVDRKPIDVLLAAGYLPVLAPIGVWDGEPGSLMNVNADVVAGDVAATLGASDLVFLTDVTGVRGNDGRLLEALTGAEAAALIGAGVASGGMVPKLKSSLIAARAGVRCHIVDGRESHALTAVLEGAGTGTRVTA